MLCKFPDLESEICDHHLIFELLITINWIYLFGIRYDKAWKTECEQVFCKPCVAMINTFLVPVKLVYVLKTMRLNSEAIFVLKKTLWKKVCCKGKYSVIWILFH